MNAREVERLYKEHGFRVYSRCMHLLKEEGAAMDIVQDTFVALMRRPIEFPDEPRAVSWLLKVATNRCLNVFRHRKYWKTQEYQDVLTPQTRGTLHDSGVATDSLEDRGQFHEVLSGFKARKASVIVSYFLEGKTLHEVADESGYSVPTVRRTLSAFLEAGERKRKGT